ncbi:MAG: putative glycosyltransferase, partial [Phycisphaerales bacterium]|nr:putative glycosyltransferase [Phycisphaerales bacterium]
MTSTEAVVSPETSAVAVPDPAPSPAAQTGPLRTVWGLDPLQLHNRYWAAHGVQVVAQGEPSEIVKHAELYLLVGPGSLALF